MGNVYTKAVIDMALSQVGKSCGKTNEYSEQLDSVHFYNYPKNGVADSCSIFVDDMVFRCSDPQDAEYVRSVMYEPNNDNCGASCKYAVSYFKKNKAYITDPKKFQLGDKIFFKKKDGKLYHTGIIVELGEKIITVEGNTSGGKVAKKSYSFNDEKIDGAGRPRYTAFEAPTEEPHQDPVPAPEPTPAPEPAYKQLTDEEVTAIAREVMAGKYGDNPIRKEKLIAEYGKEGQARIQQRVNELLGYSSSSGSRYMVINVTSFLNVRTGPSTKYASVGKLHNGDEVRVYQQKNGWAKIEKDRNRWVSMSYLSKIQ